MFCFFFFNDTATTEIYTLSLHDALPIYVDDAEGRQLGQDLVDHLGRRVVGVDQQGDARLRLRHGRSEEHTSELQSLTNLVCRLLLEKKKQRSVDLTCLDTSNYRWTAAAS